MQHNKFVPDVVRYIGLDLTREIISILLNNTTAFMLRTPVHIQYQYTNHIYSLGKWAFNMCNTRKEDEY